MKVLRIEDCTVTSLFIAGQPNGMPNVFLVATKLIERYKFQKVPPPEELLGTKTVFEHGSFGDTPIKALEAYNDGLIVRGTCSTERLDAFTDDVLTWLNTEFGVFAIETHKTGKAYDCTLTVELDPKVFAKLESLMSLKRVLSRELQMATGRPAPSFETAGIMFAVSEGEVAGLKPTPLRIERKLGTDFEKNLFVSTAPLPTAAHIRVLEHLEETG